MGRRPLHAALALLSWPALCEAGFQTKVASVGIDFQPTINPHIPLESEMSFSFMIIGEFSMPLTLEPHA